MRTFTLFFLIFGLVACDSSTTRRSGTATGTSTSSTSPTLSAEGATSNFGSTNTSSTSTTSSVGYESCNLNPRYYSYSVGYIGLCKSTTTTNEIKVYFQSADAGDKTCIIPTYTDSSGSSTYIGVAQCTSHNAGDTKVGTLSINRSGYTNYTMNSVIVMKYALLSSYYLCMDSAAVYMSSCMSPYLTCAQQATKCANLAGSSNTVYSNYFSGCPGTTTSCSTQASQCMNTICSIFKSSNSSKYINITL